MRLPNISASQPGWCYLLIKLKPRLAGVASCIDPGSMVADIGTNHGYLPLYLVQQGISGKVIGTEKFSRNLDEAKKNILSYNLAGAIKLLQGDGFIPIKNERNIDIVVIAGMGGRTIIDIIKTGHGDFGNIKKFIFQPMGDVNPLISWLVKNGFCISAAKLAFEEKRFYEIIIVGQKSQKKTDDDIVDFISLLIDKGDPLLIPYLKHKIKICRSISRDLKKSPKERALKKLLYYKEKEKKLKEVLSFVTEASGSNESHG